MEKNNPYNLMSKPKIKDLPLIKDLLLNENLPVEGIEEHLNNFLSLRENGLLIGVVGLEIYGNKALLRSLAVHKSYRYLGYGKKLCREIIEKAKRENISELFLLTETAAIFFYSLGFEIIKRDSADEKVKSSQEFKTICPSTAICMRLKLEESCKTI